MSSDQPTSPVPNDPSGLHDTPALADAANHGGGERGWHTHLRLVLTDGTELLCDGPAFAHEPHLGDLMASAGQEVMRIYSAAKDNGVLRFLPFGESLFFTPVEKVAGIYVDLIDPDDNEVTADDIKTGWYHRDHPHD